MGTRAVSSLCAGFLSASVGATSTFAQVPAPATKPVATAPLKNASPAAQVSPGSLPSYEAMRAVIDKIFPPLPDPDPARLASARASVQAMWPDGSYAKMMSGFMDSVTTGVMRMKKSDLAPLSSKTPNTKKTGTADVSIRDQAAAKDPYFDQRMAATLGVLHEEVAKLSNVIDPRMREGLARSMARRFDVRELADINAFFATPSGRAFASEYLQLWFEPDTIRSMFSAFPEMLKLMPDASQKLKAVNERFPKPAPAQGTTPKH